MCGEVVRSLLPEYVIISGFYSFLMSNTLIISQISTEIQVSSLRDITSLMKNCRNQNRSSGMELCFGKRSVGCKRRMPPREIAFAQDGW